MAASGSGGAAVREGPSSVGSTATGARYPSSRRVQRPVGRAPRELVRGDAPSSLLPERVDAAGPAQLQRPALREGEVAEPTRGHLGQVLPDPDRREGREAAASRVEPLQRVGEGDEALLEQLVDGQPAGLASRPASFPTRREVRQQEAVPRPAPRPDVRTQLVGGRRDGRSPVASRCSARTPASMVAGEVRSSSGVSKWGGFRHVHGHHPAASRTGSTRRVSPPVQQQSTTPASGDALTHPGRRRARGRPRGQRAGPVASARSSLRSFSRFTSGANIRL